MTSSDVNALHSNFSRSNLHGQVAHALGERIIRGELAPGSLLPPEAELSRQIGVSRTALREAIKLMAAKGLVESRRKAGTRVRPRAAWNFLDPDVLAWQLASSPSSRFAENLFELRAIVEPEAAALAAERLTDIQAAQLKAAWTTIAQAENGAMWLDGLRTFYRVILAAADNEMIEALGFLPEATFAMALQYEWIDENRPLSVTHRRAVIEAITARDPDRARQAMRGLVDFVRRTMMVAIGATGDRRDPQA